MTKKAQVSLEILIIIGILIIGAIIFSVILITNLNKAQDSDDSTNVDDFIDDFEKDVNEGYTSGSTIVINKPIINNGVCL